MAQSGGEIGVSLLFPRKSGYVTLNMLKLASKTESGQQTAPFYEVLFCCPLAVWLGKAHMDHFRVGFLFLLLSKI